MISGTHKALTAAVGSVPREVGRISAAGTKREDDGDGGCSVSMVVRSQLVVVVAPTAIRFLRFRLFEVSALSP